MNVPDEERLAALLRCLPPAPAGWVAAARELPRHQESGEDTEAHGVRSGAGPARADNEPEPEPGIEGQEQKDDEGPDTEGHRTATPTRG